MIPVVEVRDLHFAYGAGQAPALRGVRLTVERGWRCVLIGANGAGKTTLLRVLGGKHMVPPDQVRVLGRPAFHDTSLADEVELLGGGFPFAEDVPVSTLVAGVLRVDPARRDELLQVLDIDPAWRMHRVSDGQRRRVQILLGLLRPSRLLLLDEVTTDLDVVARQDLLGFLRREGEQHGTTLLYATHIFDGMDSWATHLAYLRAGTVDRVVPMADLADLADYRRQGASAPLLRVVLDWLRAERT
jgi:CCR4-NOT complex subunit CAF16